MDIKITYHILGFTISGVKKVFMASDDEIEGDNPVPIRNNYWITGTRHGHASRTVTITLWLS